MRTLAIALVISITACDSGDEQKWGGEYRGQLGQLRFETVCAPGCAKLATLLPNTGTIFSVWGLPGTDDKCQRPTGWSVESSDPLVATVMHTPSTTLPPDIVCAQQMFDVESHAAGEALLTVRDAGGAVLDRLLLRVREAAGIRLDAYFGTTLFTLPRLQLGVGEGRQLEAAALDEAGGAFVLNGGARVSWSFADTSVASFVTPGGDAPSSELWSDWVHGRGVGQTTLTIRFGPTARDYDVTVR